MGDSDSIKLFKFVRSVAYMVAVAEKKKRGERRRGRKMMETLLSMGVLGVLIFIASKLEVINHNTDMIVDFLIGKGKPPLPLPVRGGNDE